MGVALATLLPACSGSIGRKLLITAKSLWLLLELGYSPLSNCVTAFKYAAGQKGTAGFRRQDGRRMVIGEAYAAFWHNYLYATGSVDQYNGFLSY
jgi:hypothetical protein